MTWYCDSCGQNILTAREGIIEWKNTSESDRFDLHLVHNTTKCTYDGRSMYLLEKTTVSHSPLEWYLGDDGLMMLLEEISLDLFLNKREVIEMIKRLHINGYDAVYTHIDEACSEGVVECDRQLNSITQENIKAIQEWLFKREL